MSDTVQAVLIDGKPIGYFPPTSADNVTYEEGVSVKDALDRLPIEIKIVEGTTPSDLNTFAVIAGFPTGWNANNTYILGFVFHHLNNEWYSNNIEVSVITTGSMGIRVKVPAEEYANRPIKVMLARIV